ncbi:MAG TPA: hypothetical protein VKY74_18275, partial [Chloroflexia bacterium]|nr:hypothetical protein [Chloroflexia bacterium]
MSSRSRKAAGDSLPNIATLPAALAAAPTAEAREQLRQALLQQKLPHLRAIAAARHTTRSGQREALAATLLDHLLDPAAQATFLGDLGPPERAILALARLLDWSRSPLAAGTLQHVLGGAFTAPEVDRALAHLGERGLLLPSVQVYSRYDAYYQLPAALGAGLLPLLPEIQGYNGDLPPPATDDDPYALGQPVPLRKIAALLDALAATEYHLADWESRTYRGQPTWALGRWEVVGELPARPARATRADPPVGLQVATG